MWWMYIYSINSRKQKIEDKRSNYRPTSLMLDKRTNIIHYYKVNMIYQYILYLFSTCIDEICIHGVRHRFVRLNRMTYVPWYLFKLSSLSLSLSKHLLGRDFADKNANWYQWYWTQEETDTLKAVSQRRRLSQHAGKAQGTFIIYKTKWSGCLVSFLPSLAKVSQFNFTDRDSIPGLGQGIRTSWWRFMPAYFALACAPALCNFPRVLLCYW